MNLIDLNNAKSSNRAYGGASCSKAGIIYEDNYYLIKFPGNLKIKPLKNINASYSNSSVCEYIGSHIFEMLGMNVHETFLAILDGKVVVACKDFRKPSIRFTSFAEMKMTFKPTLVDEFGNETDGTGSNLADTLQVVRNHPFFIGIDAELFFWKMLIGDAIIGNPDRNNGNWGLLIDDITDEILNIAPVYDNGNCLNNKWEDDKMLRFLNDEKLLKAEAYAGKQFFFTKTNGKKLNYFKIIESGNYPKCTEALTQLIPKINDMNYEALIDSVDLLTDVQNRFYKTLIKMRIEELNRIYINLIKNSKDTNIKTMNLF